MSREKRLGLRTFQIDQHSELDLIQEDMHVFIIYMVTQKQAVEEVGGSVCGVVCVCLVCGWLLPLLLFGRKIMLF